MTIKIFYKNSKFEKRLSDLIVFVDEKFSINFLKKHISDKEFSYISDLLKNRDIKKDLLFFEFTSKTKMFFFKSLVFNKSFM